MNNLKHDELVEKESDKFSKEEVDFYTCIKESIEMSIEEMANELNIKEQINTMLS